MWPARVCVCVCVRLHTKTIAARTKLKLKLNSLATKNQFAQNYVYAACNAKRELTFSWCIMAVGFSSVALSRMRGVVIAQCCKHVRVCVRVWVRGCVGVCVCGCSCIKRTFCKLFCCFYFWCVLFPNTYFAIVRARYKRLVDIIR